MKTLRLLFIVPFLARMALFAQSATPVVTSTPPAPGTVTAPAVQAAPAAVDAVLKALHYDEMMGKALDQQKQMIQQVIMRSIMPGTSPDDAAAFRQKALDTASAGLSPEEVHAVAMHSYGEAFTTDELRAIADFYNSPAGQALITKQVQVQQKIGAALRPRVMEAMQKIQQMTRDFAAQQKAKAAEQAAKEAAAKGKDQKVSGAPAAPVTVTTPAPVTSPKS